MEQISLKVVSGFFGAAEPDAQQSESLVATLANPPTPSAALEHAFKPYRALV